MTRSEEYFVAIVMAEKHDIAIDDLLLIQETAYKVYKEELFSGMLEEEFRPVADIDGGALRIDVIAAMLDSGGIWDHLPRSRLRHKFLAAPREDAVAMLRPIFPEERYAVRSGSYDFREWQEDNLHRGLGEQ
jgi:hypothetical protein